MFITFEGIDGCGKTTQSHRLAGALRAAGYDVVHTREPGGSPGAEEIRALILSGEADRWSAETEILLFTAARRDHLERVIEPALARGAFVICDRFADSTRVYQGAARASLRETVDRLHSLMIGREPDLTIILDIDPDTALTRGMVRLASGKIDEGRFERMGLEFQKKLYQGFTALAKDHPERCVAIPAKGEIDVVFQAVSALVFQRIPPN